MTERMENALNHIKTSVDVDPWAVEEVERVFKAVDDIKAEIQASMDMYKGCEYIGDKARRDELWHVLEIIDKHTGKERANDN